MIWNEALNQLHEAIVEFSPENLTPMFHRYDTAHVNVVVDITGKYVETIPLQTDSGKNVTRCIPMSTASASRTRNKCPHPLHDSVSYISNEYNTERYDAYIKLLADVVDFSKSKKKYTQVYSLLSAILKYVKNNNVVDDWRQTLVRQNKKSTYNDMKANGILPKGSNSPAKIDAIKIVWTVRKNDTYIDLVDDKNISSFMIDYFTSKEIPSGNNYDNTFISTFPKKVLVYPGDSNCKLSTLNDKDSFSYRGRLTESSGSKASEVQHHHQMSLAESYRIHSTLWWLQAMKQYVVSNKDTYYIWAIPKKKKTQDIQDFMIDITMLNNNFLDYEVDEDSEVDNTEDFGKRASKNIKLFTKGYKTPLNNTDVFVLRISEVDSGRAAITLFERIEGSKFEENMVRWASKTSRLTSYRDGNGNKRYAISSPTIYDIVKLYDIHDKNGKATQKFKNDILGCFMMNKQFPNRYINHLVNNAVKTKGKTTNWYKNIGTLAGVLRAYDSELPPYLSEDRVTQNYITGRIFAIIAEIHDFSLRSQGKKRNSNFDTNISDVFKKGYNGIGKYLNSIVPYMRHFEKNPHGRFTMLKKEMHRLIEQASTDIIIGNRYDILIGFMHQREFMNRHRVENQTWKLKGENDEETK